VNWVLVILAALGSGALGSVVTAYGPQARERRAARGEARACAVRVEQFARHANTSPGYHAQLVAALDALDSAMLMAGLPQYLARFYAEVRLLAYATQFSEPPEERRKPGSHWIVSTRVAHQTAGVLDRAIWRPWLSAPTRRWRIRRLRRTLDAGMPARASMQRSVRSNLRSWEKSLRQPEAAIAADRD